MELYNNNAVQSYANCLHVLHLGLLLHALHVAIGSLGSSYQKEWQIRIIPSVLLFRDLYSNDSKEIVNLLLTAFWLRSKIGVDRASLMFAKNFESGM